MKKFSWAITAGPRTSNKLNVGEAEGKLDEALVLLKQVRHTTGADFILEELDELIREIASSIDKVRKVRNNLRGL